MPARSGVVREKVIVLMLCDKSRAGTSFWVRVDTFKFDISFVYVALFK